jgi:hypothetical protein
MRPTIQKIILAAITVFIVNACTAENPYRFLPLPYQPGDKGQNKTSMLVLSGHVVVFPVEGLDDDTSNRLADATVEQILRHEIIATRTRPRQRTSSLEGKVEETDGSKQITWTYHGPYGAVIDRFSTPLEKAPIDVKALASTVALHLVPEEATRTIARVPDDQNPRYVSPNFISATAPKIMVTAIFGAPNGGGAALRAGVINALRGQGFAVVERPGKTTHQLQCNVALSESQEGYERLSLTWELKSPQGTVLASIDQANEIPIGTLNQGWQGLAEPITQGAATGISEYFRAQQ